MCPLIKMKNLHTNHVECYLYRRPNKWRKPRCSNFNERCYALLAQIPTGKVTTYKEMARALGSNAWRAVGSAMAKNPNLITTPCHRVIRSDGGIGDYALGSEKKAELLRSEGIKIKNDKVSHLDLVFYQLNTEE